MQKSTAKNSNLIYDVGMHRGQDTDFYLKKGFQVIGFEANPENARFCRERFAAAVETGDLIIVEGAITDFSTLAENRETVKFYRNEDHSLWGSTCGDWAYRNEVMGTSNEIIEVAAIDFVKCVEKYGVPFYLKADIVGSETVCLKALLEFENKPDYLSIRSEKVIFSKLEEEFKLLERLGYDCFKAIQQDFIHLKVPVQLNGENQLYSFEEGGSGPFAEESEGEWLPKDEVLSDYKKIFVYYWLFGDYSYLIQTEKGRKFIAQMERIVRRPLPGWFDTHARHSSVVKKTAPDARQTESLKAQSAWLLFAKIVGFGFSFLLPLLIVRYLSKENVGVYRESFLVIVNAVAILPFGFSMSAYYYLSRGKEKRHAAILNILLFNFIVGGLACLALYLYPQMLGNLFRSEELTLLAPKIGLIIWIWMFSSFLETVAIANREARLATAFIIFAQFSKTFLMVGAVLLFGTVESFIYAAIIQGLLQTAILLVYLNYRFPKFWTAFRPAFFLEQMIYAVPFGLAGVLWILQNDIHNYFVAYKFTSAEFAIYAYGCFQLPLIAMLAESVISVLIPRMSELQAVGDRQEMIRLTARAMQKLAFFYFPIYVFLIITAQTFIITLFTTDYLASVPILIVNLTLLPFGILITDPIVRAYKELGRFLLVLRIFILAALIAVLYFGLESLDMLGMITIAVVAILIEKAIAETVIVRKLGFGRKDFHLLKNVGKTAVISLAAGVVTYFVYTNTKIYLLGVGEHFAQEAFHTTKLSVLNFAGGSLTLLISALVFTPLYLLGAYFWGVIEEDEKLQFKNILKKLRSLFGRKTIPNPQSQTQN
ncbi:MAG: oligosaccharide flippase family protein [Acidobacteriota bacterium]|nr:oligosaccharide flippase family protein [Acidobacteriota bacterium]